MLYYLSADKSQLFGDEDLIKPRIWHHPVPLMGKHFSIADPEPKKDLLNRDPRTIGYLINKELFCEMGS